MPNHRRRAIALPGILALLALTAGGPGLARAQTDQPTPVPQGTPTPVVADEYDRGTPRSTMRAFLERCWAGQSDEGTNFLDLRRLPQAERTAHGPKLAHALCSVIDRTIWLDPEQLDDTPEGDRADGLSARREVVGTIQTAQEPVRLLLERVPRDDGTLVWKVSSETVAKTPALYDEFGYGPLGEWLPAPLLEIRFWHIQLWQWLSLLLLAAASYLVAWLPAAMTVRIIRAITRRTRAALDQAVLDAAAGPIRLALAVLLFFGASYGLALSVRTQAFIGTLAKLLVIVTTTWLLLRVVDLLVRGAVERRQVTLSFVPLLRRVGKTLVVVLAVLVGLQTIGFDVTNLLAGLGIGGLAIALAGQKTVEHLFGGVTLVADQPVRVGDLCRFGGSVGVVEDIGLRSTRIRTVDRTVISVPNAEFAGMQLENISRRDRIRLQATIGVRYETTPDQLRWLLIELRSLLLAHSRVDPAQVRVRFLNFGVSSLDIELAAYVVTTDFDEFCAIREDIFLRVMDAVAASGTGFAFPSQTVYASGDGLDPARREAAEAQVAAWRARGELPLPDFTPERAAALRNTLEYPPKGSALHPASNPPPVV